MKTSHNFLRSKSIFVNLKVIALRQDMLEDSNFDNSRLSTEKTCSEFSRNISGFFRSKSNFFWKCQGRSTLLLTKGKAGNRETTLQLVFYYYCFSLTVIILFYVLDTHRSSIKLFSRYVFRPPKISWILVAEGWSLCNIWYVASSFLFSIAAFLRFARLCV